MIGWAAARILSQSVSDSDRIRVKWFVSGLAGNCNKIRDFYLIINGFFSLYLLYLSDDLIVMDQDLSEVRIKFKV